MSKICNSYFPFKDIDEGCSSSILTCRRNIHILFSLMNIPVKSAELANEYIEGSAQRIYWQ